MLQAQRSAAWPLGRLSVGAIRAAGIYGAIGALIGSRIPQLSTRTVGSHHFPVRLLHSTIVFGFIGSVMLYLGFAALGVLPSVVDRLSARWHPAGHVITGVLIGGFLLGRPWPLFDKMFAHPASTHNLAYGCCLLHTRRGWQHAGDGTVVRCPIAYPIPRLWYVAGRPERPPRLRRRSS